MKKIVVITVLLTVVVMYFVFAPKLKLTADEQEFITESYYASQLATKVYGELAQDIEEYIDGDSGVNEMFDHMVTFGYLEQTINTLPKAPDKYTDIQVELSETFEVFSDAIVGMTTSTTVEESRKKIDDAILQLNGVNTKISVILEKASLEGDMLEIEKSVKEISNKFTKTSSK